MTIRFTPARLALSYIALGALALALLAVPLWYGYHTNVGTFRAYVPGAEMQRLVDVFHRDGPQGLAAAMEIYAKELPPGEIAVFADPRKQRLAGNLSRWPAQVPDTPGTYGLVIDLDGKTSMRVVTSHVTLPGGYLILMGRESVRFESLVALFWYGIAGAVAIVLSLGLVFGWLLRRAHGQLEGLVAQRTAALQLSEERYGLAMEASEEGYVDVNIETGEFVTSERLNEIFGIAPGTRFSGRSDFLNRFRFYRNDGEIYLQAIRAVEADGGPDRYQFEFRIVLSSGELRWIGTRGKVMRDAEGRARRRVGVFSDITVRKRSEEALRLSEERYARAMEGSDAGHWDWNIVTDEMFVSERAREMLALPQGVLPARRSEIMALVPMHPDDRAGMIEKVNAALRSGILARDYRVIAGPGQVRWLRSRGKVYHDARGAAVRMTGSLTDITERKLAAEALRASEERYSLALEATEEGHFDVDIDKDELLTSERLNEIYGFPPGTRFLKRSEYLKDFRFYGNDAEIYHAGIRAAEAKGGPECYEFEYRILRPSGEMRWVRTRGKVTRDTEGRALRRTGMVADITDRKLAEEEVRLSKEELQSLMASVSDYLWSAEVAADGSYSYRYYSPVVERITGWPPERLLESRERWLELLHPLDRPWVDEIFGRLISGATERVDVEYRIVRADGTLRWVRDSAHGTRVEDGRILLSGVVGDVTARKQAEEALRASEERYSLAMEASAEGHFDWNVPTDDIFVSAHIKKVFGFPLDGEFRTRNDLTAHIPYHPDDAPWLLTMARDILAGSALAHEFEYRILRGGEIHWLQARWKIVRDAAGAAQRVIGVVADVTERRRAAEELRDSEARFRALTELSSDWYWRQDDQLRFTYISHKAADGKYPPDSVIGKTRWELSGVTPLSSNWAEHRVVLAARQPFRDFEYATIGQDGRRAYVSISGAPIFDQQGVFRGYQGVGRSISERKHAEEELKAMERKLRQAQRLEAMGTLAGGIAHDFNNILGAILGFGEMAMRDAAKGSRLWRDLDCIMDAGERGRALVDRVLAFSRSSVGERVPVHAERVVREALDQLSAKLPPDIKLHAKLHAARAAMQGDPTQVHQVLMNLATNAIHAMAGGGTLRVSLRVERIEQARAPTIGALAPAEYLVLQVADTGTGIAPDVLERMFDPFFTTKEVGTGTGLGLSIVHSTVTELGGAIDVASTVGAGSTFTIYLPRTGDAVEADPDETLSPPRGDGQCVLVVDDEEPLVRLATRTLEELGYAPVGFTSSRAALAAFRADPQRFDAVITDERMPGMSGSALIRKVRGIRDGVPVVLMSGYVGDAVARQAREAGAEEVLRKPLSAHDLATSLARVLHA